MSSLNGWTSGDVWAFEQLLIKANDFQLDAAIKAIKAHKNVRLDRALAYADSECILSSAQAVAEKSVPMNTEAQSLLLKESGASPVLNPPCDVSRDNFSPEEVSGMSSPSSVVARRYQGNRQGGKDHNHGSHSFSNEPGSNTSSSHQSTPPNREENAAELLRSPPHFSKGDDQCQ